MSSYFKSSELSDEQKNEMIKQSTMVINNKAISLFSYSIDEKIISIPFNLFYKIMKTKPNQMKHFPSIDINFTGELRDYQKVLRRQVVNSLNETGSAYLKLHCGAGKTCLAINLSTKIFVFWIKSQSGPKWNGPRP